MINSQCHLIAVVGGKGGVGKSVFAANFAAALMTELKTPVLLIDADSKSCGDQNIILNLKPNKTIPEVAAFQGSLNPQAIPQLVTQHPSGLSFIGAVRGPEETLLVKTELFLKQLEFLSRNYKFIVVDLGNDLKDLQMSLLQEATAAMIVTLPEVLVVNQTQRLISDLLTATLPLEMFQLVINRNAPNSLAPQLISQSLRLQPVGIIPQDDIATMAALQRGVPFVLNPNKTPIVSAYFDIVRKITGGTLQRLKGVNKQVTKSLAPLGGADFASSSNELDGLTSLKLKVHKLLIAEMNLKKGITETNNDPVKEQALKQQTMQKINQIIDKESPNLNREERKKAIEDIFDEALGLGPLENLLKDPSVTEIMVNGHKKIYVERSGKAGLSGLRFTSDDQLLTVVERIVFPLGRQINESSPYVDARLKDGSRVNAVIPPLAIDGPSLTIRKFRKGGITPESYVSYGSMTKNMLEFLKICVENKMNVVISGGTGSGKTSLLNMLSSFISTSDRVITIEDAAELQLAQDHVVRLESKPPGMDGKGSVTIRDLVRNALRMRPDRIIVGECRDGAALDMLSAMNTGHDGSMTTTHANTPRECISRLQNLCLMAGMDLPAQTIKEQIASAVHIVVQISRLGDGSRKITHITEITGMQGESFTMNPIFEFEQTGMNNGKIVGTFSPKGMPTFLKKLEQKQIKVPIEIFKVESQQEQMSSQAQPKAAPNLNVISNPMGGIKKTGTGVR